MAADENEKAEKGSEDVKSSSHPKRGQAGLKSEQNDDDDDDRTTDEDEVPAAASSSPAARKKKKTRLPLPPRVERALEVARAAAKADRERKGGRWLAVFPIMAGAILLLLMMPRSTRPDAIPLPRIDQRVTRQIALSDDALAASAERERLPTDVLAVGSAFREVNRAEAHDDPEVTRIDAKHRLDISMRDLPRRATLNDELLSLRALQTRRFLDGVARWEKAGETTQDLAELGGGFIERMRAATWLEEPPAKPARRVLLGETERRVAFKTVWNTLVGVDTAPAFALALDEQRALYAFYIQHPHPPEARRLTFEAQRRSVTTPEGCAKVNAEEDRQKEIWLADKIKRLAAIDPSYPASYALGVAYYHAGRFDLSAEAFNAFIIEHPDGPFALRAKNHLKAALADGF